MARAAIRWLVEHEAIFEGVALASRALVLRSQRRVMAGQLGE
jgi:hypothetical protein